MLRLITNLNRALQRLEATLATRAQRKKIIQAIRDELRVADVAELNMYTDAIREVQRKQRQEQNDYE